MYPYEYLQGFDIKVSKKIFVILISREKIMFRRLESCV